MGRKTWKVKTSLLIPISIALALITFGCPSAVYGDSCGCVTNDGKVVNWTGPGDRDDYCAHGCKMKPGHECNGVTGSSGSGSGSIGEQLGTTIGSALGKGFVDLFSSHSKQYNVDLGEAQRQEAEKQRREAEQQRQRDMKAEKDRQEEEKHQRISSQLK